MLYLATITLAISFVAQFMINVDAHSLSAHQDRHKDKRLFIVMEGADTILDCNGYKIFGSEVDRVGLAVVLRDGASAINCPIGNVDRGIVISGDECSTVMNVALAFTRADSILVENSGITVLDSIVIESSNADGIDVSSGGTGLVMSDITVSGVDEAGIRLSDGVTPVALYGDIFIEKASVDGFAIDDDFDVTAYCSLTIFDSGDEGISFDDQVTGTFTFESGSTTTSCFNGDPDIEGTGTGGFVRANGANVQCDNVANAGTFKCNEDCVILPRSSSGGFAPACLADDEQS